MRFWARVPIVIKNKLTARQDYADVRCNARPADHSQNKAVDHRSKGSEK